MRKRRVDCVPPSHFSRRRRRLLVARCGSVGLIGYPLFSRAEGAVCWSLVAWLVFVLITIIWASVLGVGMRRDPPSADIVNLVCTRCRFGVWVILLDLDLRLWWIIVGFLGCLKVLRSDRDDGGWFFVCGVAAFFDRLTPTPLHEFSLRKICGEGHFRSSVKIGLRPSSLHKL